MNGQFCFIKTLDYIVEDLKLIPNEWNALNIEGVFVYNPIWLEGFS